MLLFRIIFSKYSEPKYAPGFSGRWNREGERVLYTSTSPALAMAETMAHRLGQGYLSQGFSLITLEVPDAAEIEEISLDDLPENWRMFSSYRVTQPIGSDWYRRKQCLLLKVPSAVVPGDYNLLIHAAHPAYDQVKLTDRIPFPFDERFLQMDKALKKSRASKNRKR